MYKCVTGGAPEREQHRQQTTGSKWKDNTAKTGEQVGIGVMLKSYLYYLAAEHLDFLHLPEAAQQRHQVRLLFTREKHVRKGES